MLQPRLGINFWTYPEKLWNCDCRSSVNMKFSKGLWRTRFALVWYVFTPAIASNDISCCLQNLLRRCASLHGSVCKQRTCTGRSLQSIVIKRVIVSCLATLINFHDFRISLVNHVWYMTSAIPLVIPVFCNFSRFFRDFPNAPSCESQFHVVSTIIPTIQITSNHHTSIFFYRPFPNGLF